MFNKKKIEDIKYEVYNNFLLKKIRNIYYNILYGLINVCRWIKIIWNDRDWDYYYLLVFMHKKLEKMEKAFNSEYAWNKYAYKEAKKIMIAKNLCKRLIEDNYLDNALTNYHKKWGKVEQLEFEPCIDNPKFYKLIDNKVPRQKWDFRRSSKHSDYMKQQDIEYLFKFMSKHIMSWWD